MSLARSAVPIFSLASEVRCSVRCETCFLILPNRSFRSLSLGHGLYRLSANVTAVEGVAPTRSLEKLVEITRMNAERLDQRIDLSRLEVALDEGFHEQQLVERVSQ